MAEFATAEELAARLDLSLTEAEKARAKSLLALASGLVQQVARQVIERVEDDQLIRRGTPESTIRLPERPVESVSSVTLDGEALAEDESWYRDGNELTRPAGWGRASEALVITYTHGYTVIPDAIKAVVLEAVVRVWVNPGSVSQEGYGSERVAYADAGLVLTREERRTVRRVVSRGSESVPLR